MGTYTYVMTGIKYVNFQEQTIAASFALKYVPSFDRCILYSIKCSNNYIHFFSF